MIGIDTNVLLRLILVDDEEQFSKAKAHLSNHCTRDNPGYISVIVLSEYVWTLDRTFRFSRSDQGKAIQSLLDVENLVVEDHDLVRSALNEFKSSNVEFADCLIGRRNERARCLHTVTFDQKASKLDSFELLS